MKIVLFCHSLLSDWNHGNAHFLRGLVSELTSRGHSVTSYEDEKAWSVVNLVGELGELALSDVTRHYPLLDIVRYSRELLDLEAIVDGADLVLVHEWNPPELIEALGRLRQRTSSFRLLFHDTHHRTVSEPDRLARLDGYDGVLAFGESLRELYLRAGWAKTVFTFHEAADTTVFRPRANAGRVGDLVWVGNYGDGERTRELSEYLFEPARSLGLRGSVYGVRYPEEGLARLAEAGLHYCGWLPNYRVPLVFSKHQVTVHVPRRPYAEALPGIPTIRVFEALASGIALVSAPWRDEERLFEPGAYRLVTSADAMRAALRELLHEPDAAAETAARGLRSVLDRHTCGHRANQLIRIASLLGVSNAYGARELGAAHEQQELP
jgi:spore maturation protein CgeB